MLLRHGRTAWNHVGRAQGQADIPLDEVGLAQARAVASRLAELTPSRVWSSDLARARQTAEEVASACGVTVEVDPRLREFDVGERQGLTWDESVERFPFIAGRTGLAERLRDVPGAESEDQVRARMLSVAASCLSALDSGGTGVVVSHGGSLKQALSGLLGWDRHHAQTLRSLGNCRWATVREAADGRRQLVDYGVG